MTHQVLFIQGGGEDTHESWDNRLRESLERELGPDYAVRYPRMPHEAAPKYAAWKAALTRHFAGLDEGALLIGHSIGGTILIRTLADDPPKLSFGGIFLIAAPFVGDGGWHSEDLAPLLDLGATLPRTDADLSLSRKQGQTAPFEHVHLYAKAIPRAVVRRLDGRDHQLNDDMSEVAADILRLRAGSIPHATGSSAGSRANVVTGVPAF